MTLRLTPLWLVGASALAVMFAWLAWQIVTDTAGHVLAASHPRVALRWEPTDPAALVTLAEHTLVPPQAAEGTPDSKPAPPTPEDLTAAAALIKRALLERPLDSHALALLALIAYQQRNVHRGDRLATIAGRLSWRDTLAQTLLAGQLKRRRDYAGALAHADAIIRTKPKLRDAMYRSIADFSANAESWRAVGAFLATDDPPWRLRFLTLLCAILRDRAPLMQLYDLLAASKAPPTKAELEPLLHRLVVDGVYEKAYRIWRGTFSVDRKARTARPYNGNFRHRPDGAPFDWTIVPTAGADVHIVDAPDAKGKALSLEFSGARVNFGRNVRQLMLLPPGSYDFTVKARADDLRTHRGLWWRIDCAGASKMSLGHTEPISGTLKWSDIGLKFTVPERNCTAQWLTLALPARFDFEKEIEGQAWFMNAHIRAAKPGAGE